MEPSGTLAILTMHVSGPNTLHRVRQQCGARLEISGHVSNIIITDSQGRGSSNDLVHAHDVLCVVAALGKISGAGPFPAEKQESTAASPCHAGCADWAASSNTYGSVRTEADIG